MDWTAIAGFVVALVTLIGINLGALQWMFSRHDAARTKADEKIASVEKDLLKMQAKLPIEYVRREDWIRFGNTLEAKLDALRGEFRSEMGELKGSINAQRA